MSKTMAWLALGAALVTWNVAAEWTNTDKVWKNLDQQDKIMESDDIRYWTKWRLAELLGQCDFNGDEKINTRSDVRAWKSTRENAIKEVRCESEVNHAILDKSIAEWEAELAKNKAELAVLDSELIQLKKDVLSGKKTLLAARERVRKLDEQIKDLKNSILQKISKK